MKTKPLPTVLGNHDVNCFQINHAVQNNTKLFFVALNATHRDLYFRVHLDFEKFLWTVLFGPTALLCGLAFTAASVCSSVESDLSKGLGAVPVGPCSLPHNE